MSITGTPVDLDPIMDLARKHNLWGLEDCAQSPGATYKGRKAGTIGHVGAFSTIAGKITSTVEKIATAFVDKKAAGIPIAYATEEHRAKLGAL